MPKIIISYDGTPNDDDALALGKRLERAGATLALAYVRHAPEFDQKREEIAQHDAERRLERGASLIGQPDIARHVVVGASTGAVLGELAEREGADLLVFGSDYRTPPGRAEPGMTAQRLLDGGTVAVGVAAAGLRTQLEGEIASIAVPLAGAHNDIARDTAASLATALGVTVIEDRGAADLTVVGSAPDAPNGKIVLGGDVRNELSSARSSVIVLPAGSPLQF
jgi:hypothetical protein